MILVCDGPMSDGLMVTASKKASLFVHPSVYRLVRLSVLTTFVLFLKLKIENLRP